MNYRNCKICKGEIEIINKSHNLVKCGKCEFIFCATIFSQKAFVRTYEVLYNKPNSHYQRHSRVEYQMLKQGKNIKIGYNRKRLIKRHILGKPGCKSVLEVGSGIGLIGSFLKKTSPKLDYLGIEIDKEAFDKSQNLNLNTIHGDFKLMKTLSDSYDVIMLWEVIEHLQDLKQFLELAYDKLSENGVIIFSAPNYDRILNSSKKEETDNIYQDAPPIHLNFFTKTSVKFVFEYIGFKDIDIKVKKFPYLELTKKRFYVLIYRALIGKYFGPTIYMVAKKKR